MIQNGPSFFGGRHFTQLPDRSFKVDMTRFIRERLRPVSLQRGAMLGQECCSVRWGSESAASRGRNLSWVARQCRLDEAGTASTLQGSVSRAVVKDLSDANRAVNRLKQTEDVGLPIQAIQLVNFRTVSISDAALDLDRPDGSTGRLRGPFHHVSAPPTRISSHVLVVAQSETKCVCVSGWRGFHDERRIGRMRVDQRCLGVGALPRLRTFEEIDIVARGAHGDHHEGGWPSAD